MREIKFRAWDGQKIIIVMNLEYSAANGFMVANGWILPKAVMQYTGLKDKNGKEIYEGDTLRIWCGECRQTPPYVVKDLRSFFESIDTNDTYIRISDMEVIGNIYENPELIKEKG